MQYGDSEANKQHFAAFEWINPVSNQRGLLLRALGTVRQGLKQRDRDGGSAGYAVIYSAPMTDTTTFPPELQAAMRERDEAFYAVDAAKWGKYTARRFTTVQQNGQFMSRSERIGNLQAQKQRPYVPREREQLEQQGDLAVTRFLSGGLWVVEVWKRIDGAWATVMTQATTASAGQP